MRIDAPLVVLRVHIGDATSDQPPFSQTLQLNAGSLLHSSYGSRATASCSGRARARNLDFNEIEAVLDEIDVASPSKSPNSHSSGRAEPLAFEPERHRRVASTINSKEIAHGYFPAARAAHQSN